MGIYFFCHPTPIPRFIKTCRPTFSELCKDTPRKHCIIPWEKKKCQGVGCFVSVDCHSCCYSDEVLSDDFPARSQKPAFCFRKLKIMTKDVVEMKRKMKKYVFLASMRLKLPRFHWVNTLILPLGPNAQVHKNMFPCSFRAVWDTSRTYCIIPREKVSGGSVLWMLTTIPVVTLIRVNCSVRWLPLKKLEVSFLFQKTQSHHDQSYYKGEQNKPGSFWQV